MGEPGVGEQGPAWRDQRLPREAAVRRLMGLDGEGRLTTGHVQLAAEGSGCLGLGRETGSRLLLVCHTRQIPAHLGAVLAGTGYQPLTGLPQALRGPGPRPRSRPDAAAEARA
jgi:hypothetical protein